jgi:GTP-binding protein Era
MSHDATGEEGQSRYRAGTVALIGRPNAGKSTLMNRLVGAKLSIVSDKPQTTRHRIQGVLSEARGQLVFLDTPGVHRPHFRMNQRMMKMTRAALAEVDVVVVMIDASESLGGGSRYLIDLVRDVSRPIILVLNKVDRVAKPALLPMIDTLSRERDFVDIIPLSALRGDNTEALLASLFAALPAGPPLFPEDALTDRSMRFLAAELVREQLLQRTREELPYSTAVVVDTWDEPEEPGGQIEITATIYVDKETHKPIVIGKGGQMLKAVGTAARHEIADLAGQPVDLRLWVKVRPQWREMAGFLDSMEIT